MSLTNGSEGFTMPVMPMGYGNGFGNGGFGNDGIWWFIILLFALGGWNNGGFGGGYGGNGGAVPYITNDVQSGFDQAAVMGGLNGITSAVSNGFADVQQSLCSGFAGVNATVNNGFFNAETANNARQMANMQQAFANQTAMSQGFNALGTQIADYTCESRLASCQTNNTIQNEANATRFADANNTRDIIQSQSNGIQTIMDKLCQLELDSKNDKIADLERQLTMANLAASQSAQNAFIQQGFSDEVDALYNRLNNCPVPTTPVYGRTPIFTCGNNGGYGCGCGVA